MNAIGSYGDNVGKSLLDLILKNAREKNGDSKKSGTTPSSKSSFGDTVSITSSITKVTTSLSINASTTGGRVDIMSRPTLDYNTKMMRLPDYTSQTANNVFIGGLSKADPPAMSDEEFMRSISELAHRHAKSGVKSGHLEREYQDLAKQYISVASPDRKGLIANAARTTTIPTNVSYIAAEVYDENGTKCAHYCNTVGWSTMFTPEESERLNQFQNIYRAVYKEAMGKN